MRAQANLAPRVNAPPPGRQAALPPTLPPTPTSSLAEHQREYHGSGPSLTPVSESSPDVTISKLMPKHNPRSVPVATSRNEEESISSDLAQGSSEVRSCVINDSALAPSRSSSASLESLLVRHEGDPEGQTEDIGVEDLELSVSPWVDSLSPIPQRPREKRKSPPLKGSGYEKKTTKESNAPPKKRQRVEMEEVTKKGPPGNQSGTAGPTQVATEHPTSSNTSTRPDMKRPHNGACLEQPPSIDFDRVIC